MSLPPFDRGERDAVPLASETPAHDELLDVFLQLRARPEHPLPATAPFGSWKNFLHLIFKRLNQPGGRTPFEPDLSVPTHPFFPPTVDDTDDADLARHLIESLDGIWHDLEEDQTARLKRIAVDLDRFPTAHLEIIENPSRAVDLQAGLWLHELASLPASCPWVKFAPRFAVKLCLLPRPKAAPPVSPPVIWRQVHLTVVDQGPPLPPAVRSLGRPYPSSGAALRR